MTGGSQVVPQVVPEGPGGYPGSGGSPPKGNRLTGTTSAGGSQGGPQHRQGEWSQEAASEFIEAAIRAFPGAHEVTGVGEPTGHAQLSLEDGTA